MHRQDCTKRLRRPTQLATLLFLIFILFPSGNADAQNWQDDWSSWVYHEPGDSEETSVDDALCRRYVTLRLVETLFHKKLGSNIEIDLYNSQDVPTYNLENELPSTELRSEGKGSSPNYAHAYWQVTDATEHTNTTPLNIKDKLNSSPVIVQIDRDGSPGQDHWLLVVAHDDANNQYRVLDPDSDDFETLGYYASDVNQYAHYTASVDVDGMARIGPGIFPDLVSGVSFSQAINDTGHDYHSDEWAYVNDYLGEDVNMSSDVIVKGGGYYATIGGKVDFSNVSGAELRDLRVKDKITIEYGMGGIYLRDVTSAPYSSGTLVEVNDSDPTFINFTSTRSGYDGIYAHDYSGMNISSPDLQNRQKAMHIGSRSYATVAGAYFCSNNYDIYAETNAYDSDAYDNNIFSEPDPQDCIYGNVNLPSSYAWQHCGSAYRTARDDQPASVGAVSLSVHQDDTGSDAFEKGEAIYNELHHMMLDRLEAEQDFKPLKHAEKYEEAIRHFKSFARKHPGDERSGMALRHLRSLYRQQGQADEAYAYLAGVADNPELKTLHPHALKLNMSYLLHKEKPREALAVTQTIVDEYPKQEGLTVEALYDQGLIYDDYLGDEKRAWNVFAELVEAYPHHPTTRLARKKLERLETQSTLSKTKTALSEEQSEFILKQNRPNPFSDQTEIRFRLAENTHVLITVFDVTGREVDRVVDRRMEAGPHTVTWKPSGLSSGAYFYRLQADEFSQTRRMVLLK